MTTELYPGDYFEGAECHDLAKEQTLERKWLIDEIIKPELPNISDNVEKCLELLTSDQVFKMPISNGAANDTESPSIRGIITRQSGYIVDFQAVVKFPQFHRGKPVLYKMDTGKKFPLLQINSIILNLRGILKLLDTLQQEEDDKEFVSSFSKVLQLLTQSINLLQNPPRELVFPDNNNYAIKKMFSMPYTLCESTHHFMSLELVLFKNEISIDFRNLTKVTKRPWCDIDENTGKSFADKTRDELKTQRGKSISEILQQQGLHIEEPTLINNILSNFSTETTTLAHAQDFLARCITFDKKVVTECEKVLITTSDPSLISISSKLNGLENCVSNYYTNLKLV